MAVPTPDPTAYRLTVEQYHRMIDLNILSDDDRVELIEGLLVRKMTRKPPHDSTLDRLEDAIRAFIPAGWRLRSQKAVTLTDGEPEPDVAVVIGPVSRYDDHHPGPDEIAVVAEVADTSVGTDRGRKLRSYARAGIPVYWIVNLVDRQVEVYTDPVSPPGIDPHYRTIAMYVPGQGVPLTIAGAPVGVVPVDAVLP